MFLLTSGLSAQGSWICADDQIKELQRKLHPGAEEREEYNNEILREYINAFYKGRNPSLNIRSARVGNDDEYYIPVVVHVIYPDGESYGTGTNISYAQIRSQIEALNAAFGKNYPAYNHETHAAYAEDTHIRFCLARKSADTTQWFHGPGGIEYGVMRYPNRSGAYDHSITIAAANELLAITDVVTHFPFNKYLNIWLVKDIGGDNIIGYAPKPIMPDYTLDGIVMRADAFGDNTTGGHFPMNTYGLTEGKVAVHEMGHYFNLYHIFQDGCAGANAAGSLSDACDKYGDRICDIEPCTTQNIYCGIGTPNTCTANYATGTTTFDMIEDYMSYADDDCMNTFTLDQVHRMWATLHLQRAGIWDADNLAAAGVIGTEGCIPPFLNAQIKTDVSVFCTGKLIHFSNPLAGNTASTYQWNLPGADSRSADDQTITATYTIPGHYAAYLRVSDGTIFRDDSFSFTVTECHLDSSLQFMANWYFGNFGSIDFSSGAPVQTTTALDSNTIQGESSYPGELPFIGGSVSLSDSSGHLLFYTNGVSVWNGSHQKISTAPIFGATNINASQGIFYVPYPEHPGKYFIVGGPPHLFFPERTKFVEVDLNTNTVGPFHQFVNPAVPDSMSGFVTIVPHCNGTDYWILTHGQAYDKKFYAFLVTKDGIDSTQLPVMSNSSKNGWSSGGEEFKSNRKGDKLLITAFYNDQPWPAYACAIYDFDNRTGKISNERNVPAVPPYRTIPTGVSFSPNGDYFYFFRGSPTEVYKPYALFQYRLSDFAYNIIPVTGFYFMCPMQIGPDNHIYVTTQENHFNRITNPDKWGEVYVDESKDLRALDLRIETNVTIPNFIDARKPVPSHPEFSYEAIDCNTFKFSPNCFDQYTATWNFGDSTPTETGNTVSHDYPNPGEYTVSLTLSSGNTTYGSTTKTINVLAVSTVISGPDHVCVSDVYPAQYFSTTISGYTYHWSAEKGDISGANNMPFVNVNWWTGETSGKIKLDIKLNNCIFSASKNVQIQKAPDLTWPLQEAICIQDSSILLMANPAGGNYVGNGIINNRFYPSIAGLGDHTLSYLYSDEITCMGKIEKNMEVKECINCDDILNNIQLAPNPVVYNTLYFKSPQEITSIKIYNITGQKIMEGNLDNNTLSVNGLPTGLYLGMIYCPKDVSRHKLFKFLKVG